jgi:choline dehydrogenase-like flavoprotein
VFPTSVGVNPQLTIFAVARLFATEIAKTPPPERPR